MRFPLSLRTNVLLPRQLGPYIAAGDRLQSSLDLRGEGNLGSPLPVNPGSLRRRSPPTWGPLPCVSIVDADPSKQFGEMSTTTLDFCLWAFLLVLLVDLDLPPFSHWKFAFIKSFGCS